ncbi:DUF3253 domain-containing protein [Methyloversatilis discipulorum]|uniref:DUF3253 domain-containing protein n=1 Tax=Methyloversatilis discipulorum TaxID=1119528 RepID=UPI0004AEBB0E|nr:DUF3253 domain-containing protein [Methyloversatilis discipulorum]
MQRSGAADDALSDERIAETLLVLVAGRAPGRSICPSEVARALTPDWRPLMPRVRDVARRLARKGRVVVTQGGDVRDPRADWRGPIRISQPPGSASGSI